MTPTDLPTDVTKALSALVQVLEEQRIRYAIVGGVACSVRGRPRFTEDVDLVIDVPQLRLPGVLEKLRLAGFDCEAGQLIPEWTRTHMVQFQFRDVAIDWLKPVLPCLAHVIDRAPAETWMGHTVRMAIAEDLIVMKLISMRTQDVADIESLLATNRGRLNLDLVRSEIAAVIIDESVLMKFEALVQEFYVP